MNTELFEKRVINRHNAIDHQRNDYMLYRRSDLSGLAKEAFENGDEHFYCKPSDPADPYSKLIKSEPEYRWFIKNKNGLTEEEYQDICKKPYKKTAFDSQYNWTDDAERFGEEIKKVIEPVIRKGLEEFIPEAVKDIAYTIIDTEIAWYCLDRSDNG